jgi:UDP-glucuronate 4-epimerase
LNYKTLDPSKTYLITGAAGFIGYYLSRKLLGQGCKVIGIDNVNNYYDVNLKHTRLGNLEPYEKFTFIKGDISDKDMIMNIFEEYKPNVVVNLAAQAGVRYSIENPDIYIQSNIIGFYNILEACRYNPVDHLVYASSSSVYGANKKVPFEETDFVDNPVSLYASTKKSNELMAHTYSHLYKIPATGLRFFTVYGPMGRPDMAYFGFTDKYFIGEPIKIFNNGDFENDLYRDFTYIENVIEANLKACKASHEVAGQVFNTAFGGRENLIDIYYTLTKSLNKDIEPIFGPDRAGDIKHSNADIGKARGMLGYEPEYDFAKGLSLAIEWYKANL